MKTLIFIFLIIGLEIFVDSQQVGFVFEILNNQIVSNMDYLIDSTVTINKMKCLLHCASLSGCILVTFNVNIGQCDTFWYNSIGLLVLNNDPSLITWSISRKFNYISGLTNYWPLNGQDWRDYITGFQVINCVNVAPAVDRFDRSDSALYFNSGYCTLKPGVYFDGSDYSITAWIKPIQFGDWKRIVEFGNGAISDNIDISYDTIGTHKINSEIYWNSQVVPVTSSKPLNANEWTHVATVLNSTHLSVYLNGSYSNAIQAYLRPRNVNRTICTIGQNSWTPLITANAIFDDIRIYKRALSETEIINDMNSLF